MLTRKRRRPDREPAVRVVRARVRPSVPRTRGGLVQTERKYFDSGKDPALIVNTADTWASCEVDPATLNCLFAPTEGNGIENRVGNKVMVHKITIRGRVQIDLQPNQTSMDNPVFVRLILYTDKQTNGTQAQAEDLMDSGGSLGEASYMFQNTANFGRFQVLRDKLFQLSPSQASYDGTNIEVAGVGRLFKFTVAFKKPLQVRFNNTNGGTVADIIDNSFHLIAHATTGGVSANIDYKVRTVFTDP